MIHIIVVIIQAGAPVEIRISTLLAINKRSKNMAYDWNSLFGTLA
jgi:hypothetical protein